MRERNREDRRKNGFLSGSYTVEASLVMSFTLLFIAALLTGIFQVHSRVVGNFVLQEGLERLIYLETTGNEEVAENRESAGNTESAGNMGKAGNTGIVEEAEMAKNMEEIAEEEVRRLKSFFWCGGSTLKIRRGAGRFSGSVKTAAENEISVKDFDPETFLRIVRAAGV